MMRGMMIPSWMVRGGVALWAAGVLASLPVSGRAEIPGVYEVRWTVNTTGNSAQGLVDANDVAVGDGFTATIELDLFATQDGGSGPSGASFTGSVGGFSLEVVAGNAGTFVPDVTFYTSQVLFSPYAGEKTLMQVFITPLAYQEVNYTATIYDIENNAGVAKLSTVGFAFLVDGPFVYEPDAVLAEYLIGFGLSGDFAGFTFAPTDDPDVPDLEAAGPLVVVPEPGTVALVACGFGALCVMARGRRSRGGGNAAIS